MSAVEIEDAILKHPRRARGRGDRRARRAARPGRQGLRRRRARRRRGLRRRRSRISCARASASTNTRARSRSWPSCPRRPPARSTARCCASASSRRRPRPPPVHSTDRTRRCHATEAATQDRTRVPQDHRAGPGRPARSASACKIGATARAVVPRGDARQHPPLRARHRRRQPAVVRSRLRGEDALRRHRRAAELPVRHQPHHLGLRRRPAGRARDVVGRRLDLAQAGPAQRRDHDRGLR